MNNVPLIPLTTTHRKEDVFNAHLKDICLTSLHSHVFLALGRVSSTRLLIFVNNPKELKQIQKLQILLSTISQDTIKNKVK